MLTAMQFYNLIIFLVLGGKCYILFPNHKIEILYAILGCFTNLSIEGKSRIVIVYKDSSPKLKKSKYYLLGTYFSFG